MPTQTIYSIYKQTLFYFFLMYVGKLEFFWYSFVNLLLLYTKKPQLSYKPWRCRLESVGVFLISLHYYKHKEKGGNICFCYQYFTTLTGEIQQYQA